MNEVLCRYLKLTFFGQLLIILLQNIIKNLYSAVKVYHLLLFFFSVYLFIKILINSCVTLDLWQYYLYIFYFKENLKSFPFLFKPSFLLWGRLTIELVQYWLKNVHVIGFNIKNNPRQYIHLCIKNNVKIDFSPGLNLVVVGFP